MWNEIARILRAEGRYAVGEGTVARADTHRAAHDRAAVPWVRLMIVVITGGVLYGAVMGSLGARASGVVYSAVKVPILLVFALLTCLPSFYAMNAVLGLRRDFAAAVRGVLAAQGTLAVALAALAPVTAFFYACDPRYPAALLLNGAVFALALAGAQVTLARHYRPLIARDRRHRVALVAWFALYAFVSIKVGWVLRPFVGDPALPLEFLREGKWQENPYANLFWTVVGFGWGVVRKLTGMN